VAPTREVDEAANKEGIWPETLTGDRKLGVDGDVDGSRVRGCRRGAQRRQSTRGCLGSGEVEEGGWLCSLGADGVSRRQLRLGRAR
jgi:hypothetical protein